MESNQRRTLMPDIIINAIIILVSLYVLIASIPYKAQSRLFPQIVAAITLILCVVQVSLTLWRASKTKAAKPLPESNREEASKTSVKKGWNHLLISSLALIFIVLLKPLGFIICTLTALTGIPYLLGNRKHLVIWVTAVVITLVFYYVFKLVFYISLPKGILPFM